MTKSGWNPSNQYQKVAEANRRLYRRSAEQYDKIEYCITSERRQKMLLNDLEIILSMILRSSKRQVRALDACGGSGDVALKLLAQGVDITLCDISPEMIRIFESKCNRKGLSHYTTTCQEIGSFLSSTKLKFDLIVFSSALHHIEDYTSVLKMAFSHLDHNGFIYTVFDPPKFEFPTYQIVWFDWFLHHFSRNPSKYILNAIKEKLSAESKEAINFYVGTLAEYHVNHGGIDDFALVDSLEKIGAKVIWHSRYSFALHASLQLFLSALKRPTEFKLLIQKPQFKY